MGISDQSQRPVPVTDSATFTPPEAGDDTGEDLGGLDDLLEALPTKGSTTDVERKNT